MMMVSIDNQNENVMRISFPRFMFNVDKLIIEAIQNFNNRIDRIIQFEKLNNDGRIKMSSRICKGLDRSSWEHLLVDGENDTGAQFQYRCSTLAGKLFWEGK